MSFVRPLHRPALDSRTAVIATIVLFAVNGAIIGGWGGILPSLRAMLHLSPTHIGLMLFAAGVAAIAAMQAGGRLSDTIGARRVTLSGLPFLIAGAVVLIFTTHYATALVAAVLIGLGNGVMDVSMNAVGVQVEQARRRPIMSRFHALWSVGNLLGAATVLGVGTAFHLSGPRVIAPVMASLAVVAAAALLVLLRITPSTRRIAHRSDDGRRIAVPTAAWILGIMALCFGLSEGTATDWSSIHVTVVGHVSPSTGAAGLVTVSAFMVVIRLLGDALVVRFGRRAVVRFGGGCAAVGYAITVVAHPLPLILVGWALVGFGVGMIAPQVYAVAGHMGGGRVLAVVVTFGYAAFLIGPAIMGFTVEHIGVQHAMILPLALCIGIVALAVTMPKEDHDLADEDTGVGATCES